MATLNETPSANRLHIGIFGKTNSGKSSFLNALTGQRVSIVADMPGTTTDPVYKAMEISPIGPCSLIDTAGFDDETSLGEARIESTRLAAEKTELAVMIFSATDLEEAVSASDAGAVSISDVYGQEQKWIHFFQEKHTPVLMVVNKIDLVSDAQRDALVSWLSRLGKEEPLCISAQTGEGIDKIKDALARKVPEGYGNQLITGSLVGEDDVVLLVMPQDIQAPKGRLILPQVQTLRELLDKKCLVMSVTDDKLLPALKALSNPPKLIITDSQVFGYVYENKPKESMLTSFSVLFAAYKGDLPYYMEGAKAIDSLNENSKVLIAECCTHAPLKEDIGRVKLPRMLRKRFGEKLEIQHVSGTDYPENLREYDLIIQCGACMFNRKYVLSRIERAKEQQVPMTNYGVTIAHLTGILDKVSTP